MLSENNNNNGANSHDMNNFGHNFNENWSCLIFDFESSNAKKILKIRDKIYAKIFEK